MIGLAPAAKVLVYQAPNSGAGIVDEYSAMVTQNLAKVISSSWGTCEPSADSSIVQTENTLFEEAALQGQSIFVASGDSGSAACAQGDANPTASDSELAVGDPASQPFATGVGGTSIFTPDTASGLWAPGDTLDESVWNDGIGIVNDNGPSGSTGGISTNWPMPSYQAGAPPALGVGSGGSGTPCGATTSLCREVPDVSANSDPAFAYVVFLGASAGWTTDGGTSAAAPLWAAFTALTNASAACRGQLIGFANPALYAIAGSPAYATDFRDVTPAVPSPVTGETNNDALGTNNGLYPVTAGYDMATGLGSPLAAPLAGSLCGARSPVYTVTVTSPGPQTSSVGQGVALPVAAADSGAAKLSYAATGLPAGLTINPATGVISGVVTSAQTTTVTVSATDTFTNASATSFPWTVVNPPPKPGKPRFSAVALRGIAKHRPALKFTLSAGSNAAPLKTLAVSLPRGLSFAHRARSLAKGIVVKSAGKRVKFKARVAHGTLTITLNRVAAKVTVTIVRPAISAGNGLASKVQRHKIKRLSLGFRLTDAAKRQTRLTAKLNVR